VDNFNKTQTSTNVRCEQTSWLIILLDMWEIEQIVQYVGCALAIALNFVILMSQPLAFRVSMIKLQ